MRPHLALLTLICAIRLAATATPSLADPRPRDVMDAAQIRLALEKLQVVGSALYVGAHPDDENTALLAWLSSGRKVRTGYLSLTRGDGGQNLIGSDIGELLGVIRTQELLAARRVDGAEQFFTRALDFGFSKNPGETLEIWGRDRILADVVWVIRSFRPDVIVTRFPTDGRGGHGHHTASALLAEEAFTAAGDSTRFPEQLRYVRPWRSRRLLWNVFRFGGQGPDTTRTRLAVDLGAYDPLLGRSFTEIAGESRSMHKSQGFGSAERRGTWVNTFEHRLGDRAATDLFEGVNLRWSRIPGGERLIPLIREATRQFRPERPQAILPVLSRVHAILATLPDEPIVRQKRAELLEVMRSCAGIWLEAIALAPSASPGAEVRVAVSVLNRSDVRVTENEIELVASGERPDVVAEHIAVPVAFNIPVIDTFAVRLPAGAQPTQPYWLAQRPLKGSFEVADLQAIGAPETSPALRARVTLSILDARVAYEVPVVYRWTDPVQGERYRDFAVVPPVTMRFDQGVCLFADDRPREVRVVVQSAGRPIEGALRLRLPEGWRADPPQLEVALAGGDADTTLRFRVTRGGGPAASIALAEFESGGKRYGSRLVRLDYPHVPIQTLLLPAEARLVRADVKRSGERIAYLMGSGDAVPDALRQMGFAVALLDDDAVEVADLSAYDAIVAGVRAYNTRPRLRKLQRRLLDYVASGGRLVIQYNTADDALQDRLGPFPFKISRDRVTVEEAPVRLPDPGHPLLAEPNRITAEDFDGWVQERGLYFANPWDPRYETVLSCGDPGEKALAGGLLFARHGRGEFVYTGFAWFRQLPAGVPGAWRLFANLVSAPRRRRP